MITLFLQAALGAIGPQALPAGGCAAYLWSRSEPPQLVAVATPASVRVAVDGRTVELARTAAEGEQVLGLPAVAQFDGAGVTARLDLTVRLRPDLSDGALVPDGTLTVTKAGADAVVAPVAGLVGCGRGSGAGK